MLNWELQNKKKIHEVQIVFCFELNNEIFLLYSVLPGL